MAASIIKRESVQSDHAVSAVSWSRPSLGQAVEDCSESESEEHDSLLGLFEMKLSGDEEKIRSSISNILQQLSESLLPDKAALKGKRNVVIVGVTGSGKSTLTNSLAGCQLRVVTEDDIHIDMMNAGSSLCVVPVSEGGPMDSVTDIGFKLNTSETQLLHPIVLNGIPITLWDAPGFEDTNGSEVNIANAVNLCKLLTWSRGGGLAMVLVLDAKSLFSSRGSIIKDTIKVLLKLFGEERWVQADIKSILCCVTKAASEHKPLHVLRTCLVSMMKDAGLHLDGNQDIIQIYDPLDRHPEGMSREALINRLLTMPPVSVREDVFRPPLNQDDISLLSRIGFVFRYDISKALRAGDLAEVMNLLDKLKNFQVIKTPVIDESMDIIAKQIKDTFHMWEFAIKSWKTDFSRKARRCLRKYLIIMEKAKELEGAMEGLTGLRACFARSESQIRQEEMNQQKREQTQVRFDLETCFLQIKSHVCDLAQRQPNKFYPRESDTTLETFLEEFSSLPQCQTLSNHLEEAKTLQGKRQSKRYFLFGDQLPLDGIIGMFSQNVVSLFKEQVEDCKKITLARNFDIALRTLRDEALQVVEREFDIFSDKTLEVQDTPQV